jgi:glycosyltransferase involved in cell wall biosynthesis
MPKISVIIPAYNSASYLSDAVESVLNQSFQDFEIIIIDDGSTDNTKEIAEKYIQKHGNKIRYFYQGNKGVGAARNKGIEESKGEYIAFLDSDDILLPESLIRRQGFLSDYPEASLVFTDYYLMAGRYDSINTPQLLEKNFLNSFKKEILAKKDDEIIFNQNFYYKYFEFSPRPIWTCAVMMRKDIIDNVGLFRTDIQIAEDNDYWPKVIRKYKVGFINRPLSCYRHFYSNLTKQTENYNLNEIKIFTELYFNNKERRVRRAIKKKLASSYYELGYYYNKCSLPNKARKYLLKSISCNPKNKDTYKSLLRTLIPL